MKGELRLRDSTLTRTVTAGGSKGAGREEVVKTSLFINLIRRSKNEIEKCENYSSLLYKSKNVKI